MLILSVMFLASTAMAGDTRVFDVMTFATPEMMFIPEAHPDITGRIIDVAVRRGLQKNLMVSFKLQPLTGTKMKLPRISKSFSLTNKTAAYKLYNQLNKASQGMLAATGAFGKVQVTTMEKITSTARLLKITFYPVKQIGICHDVAIKN